MSAKSRADWADFRLEKKYFQLKFISRAIKLLGQAGNDQSHWFEHANQVMEKVKTFRRESYFCNITEIQGKSLRFGNSNGKLIQYDMVKTYNDKASYRVIQVSNLMYF